MKHLLNCGILLLVLMGLVGCTTSTTVKVQRVLVQTAQLRDDSPAGRKVLVAVQALAQVREREVQVQRSYVTNFARQKAKAQTLLAASKDERRKEQLTGLLAGRQQLLEELTNHIGLIEANIRVLTNFFALQDAVGLAPRIDWEIMKTSLLLNQEKQWLVDNFASRLSANELGGFDDMNKELDTAVPIFNTAITATVSQGYGGFVTLGVAEIDPSDPEYHLILGPSPVAVSPDALSMTTSDISGDANVIIVQESPGEFRTYQISNDPTTLLKNVSLVVSKATAAAAKYLSGGVAP